MIAKVNFGFLANRCNRNRNKFVISAVLILLGSVPIGSSGSGVEAVQARPLAYFTDVSTTQGFGPAIHFIADNGWIGGYNTNPPCNTGVPCFLPNNSSTREQISKMLVNAKLSEGAILQNPANSSYADVPYGSQFYSYVETMRYYGWASGYSCGGPGEPCGCPYNCNNKPYFRPVATTTRGQFAKMVVSAMNQVRARITPATPTFSDVGYGTTFYTFVETAWSYFLILNNGNPYATFTFRVNDPISRGDVAMALFHATSLELGLGHASRYAGSNNWDGPNTGCSPIAGGGQATFLTGVQKGHATNYGGYTTFRPMAREILFDLDAESYHACNTSNKIAIVFHAYDFFGPGTGCQDGDYSADYSTSLPRPVGRHVKSACVQWWGPDESEVRIYSSSPQLLNADSAEYFATIEWSPDDFGAVNDGQINVDNYQLDSNLNKLYNDNMQKFCYTKGSSSTNRPNNRYGVFPCP